MTTTPQTVRTIEWASVRKSLKAPSKHERIARHQAATAANIRTRKIGKRGTMDRRILVEFVRGNVERRYHATKGWRVNVLVGGAA